MAKVLEALIAKGRRVRRPREQKEVAFGICDLSTHPELHERIASCDRVYRNAEYKPMSSPPCGVRRVGRVSPFSRASRATHAILVSLSRGWE